MNVVTHGEPGSVGLVCQSGQCSVGVVPEKENSNSNKAGVNNYKDDTVSYDSTSGGESSAETGGKVGLHCKDGQCSVGIVYGASSADSDSDATAPPEDEGANLAPGEFSLHCEEGFCRLSTDGSYIETAMPDTEKGVDSSIGQDAQKVEPRSSGTSAKMSFEDADGDDDDCDDCDDSEAFWSQSDSESEDDHTTYVEDLDKP